MADENKKGDVTESGSSSGGQNPPAPPPTPPAAPPAPPAGENKLVEQLAADLKSKDDEIKKLRDRVDRMETPPKRGGVFKGPILKPRRSS